MDPELVKVLPTVSKPTRYLGDELNAVKKDPGNPNQIRFALAFPDIYDIGMSHLGLKILYQILNSRDDVWAERAYAPWTDMEDKMRAKGIKLSSLESGLPLKDFDIVGFSLQYEMSYTTILNMLELAEIPLLAEDRNGSHPLIIAGGPCAFNPEPMADFIDLFAIGDGEEVILEIVDCYKSNRDRDRQELLNKMADIEGVYVPSLATVEELPDGTIVVSGGLKVRKRVIKDLNTSPYPVDYLLPFMRPVHDRAIIEVMRGCSRGCRFCQAGMIYRPVRERSISATERLAEEIVEKTGYEEISLSSLSTCDHSAIYEMLQRLVESPGKRRNVSISLPSLRTDAFSFELAQSLGSIGKKGLTFAPEVGTQRMQNVVNKSISISDIRSTVKSAFSAGWDSLKLYFMIGLPTETEEDVVKIAHLIKEILNVAVQANRRASLNISVSTFVPKAHTPFQWERQFSLEEIEQRQKLLTNEIGKNRRVSVSFHDPRISDLEGVLARGDRRLGQVLLAAHKFGCKLDGWTECFNPDAWMKAFEECSVDPTVYHKARQHDQALPWDHIDTYLTKEFLLAERKKAYESELTVDCRDGECTGCGVCDESIGRVVRLASTEDRPKSPVSSIKHPESGINNAVIKLRFQFAKREEVKFISHLDLLNAFTRAFRRAAIPIAYSQGFSPHPKLAFGSILPVGTTSEVEFADMDLEEHISPEGFISRANEQMPSGLEILKAQEVSLKAESLMPQINVASYVVNLEEASSDFAPRIRSFLEMDHIWVERSRDSGKSSRGRNRSRSESSRFLDARPLIRSVKMLKNADGGIGIEMLLSEGKSGRVRPEEVVRLILNDFVEDYERDSLLSSIEIRRTGNFIECQGQLLSPMEIADQ